LDLSSRRDVLHGGAVYLQHSARLWAQFPDLAAGAVFVTSVHNRADVTAQAGVFADIARERLAANTVAELPEIQAWRRTFAAMGLKPTQYRCAAEALLRRFAKEGAQPSIHPVIDLCNALSLAFAIPIAVFDAAKITEGLTVRRANGDEPYLTFGGETEHPQPDEVIFADGAGRAHARRWTNRQSGWSAIRDDTTAVLVVAEAMHESAAADIARLTATITEELGKCWTAATVSSAALSQSAPRAEFSWRPDRGVARSRRCRLRR